jgi:hypothetical protein
MRRFSVVLFVFLWAIISAGYQPDAFRVHVLFDQIYKLQEGDGVVLDAQPIGFIENIRYVREGHFKVTLAIGKGFEADISEYSRFIIVEDPLSAGKKAMRVIQTRHDGKPLKNGATIKGSDKYSVFFEDMTGDIRDGVDFLKKSMNEFSAGLKGLSENEQMKALKKEIKRFAEVMAKTKNETREKIVNEVLPLLKRDMEKLREQLRKFGREDEMAPIDDEMKKISHI